MMQSPKLKFAVIGCGFWSGYQVPAWMEFSREVELVALYNRSIGRARQLAAQYGVPYCYDDIDVLFREQAGRLDFVDIITDMHTHPLFTIRAAEQGLDVVTQKPMAPDLAAAERMIKVCDRQGVRLLVHENFRWQAPLRTVHRILDQGVIGEPFKCRLSYLTGYPVFANQPALRELSDMIIADLGSHQFDIARFLFGEVSHLYCQARSINEGIKGEDMANTLITHQNGVQTFVEMSFATISDPDPFPQTLLFIEGRKGSIRLEKDFRIRISTRNSVEEVEASPIHYSWANPDYAVVHSSIVDCNRNLLDDLMERGRAETDARDNYKTMQLVNAAYESARNHKVVFIETSV